jgi:hypothetical protein
VIGSVADPDSGSGAFLTPGSGMGKKSGSGSGMNNPDHISESLITIFRVKILKFFDVEPGFGMKKIRIWDGKNSDLGSRIRNTGDKNTKVPIALGIRLRMQEKRQGFPITDTQTTKSSTFYQQIRAGH